MDFINRYWAVLLIAFILIMLVILSYLIDKEMNKRNKKNGIKNKKEYYFELDEKKLDDVDNLEKDTHDKSNGEEKIALDYDELDIEDIDDDFNKIISKKHIINDELINDIKNIKVNPVHISKIDNYTDIELPDIKIKKDISDEDIW